jgi:hypothetical protein
MTYLRIVIATRPRRLADRIQAREFVDAMPGSTLVERCSDHTPARRDGSPQAPPKMKFTCGASFAATFAHAPILPAVTPTGPELDTEKRAAA